MGIYNIRARKSRMGLDVGTGRSLMPSWAHGGTPRRRVLKWGGTDRFGNIQGYTEGDNPLRTVTDPTTGQTTTINKGQGYYQGEVMSKGKIAGDVAGKVGSAVSGAMQIAQQASDLAQIADTSEIEAGIAGTANSDYTSASSNQSLLSQWNSTNWQKSDYSWRDVRGMSGGEMAAGVASGTIDGAMAGLQAGGPWGALAGAAVGLGSTLGGMFAGNKKAKRKAAELNDAATAANRDATNAFTQANSQLAQQSFNSQMANLSAYGGGIDRWGTLGMRDRLNLMRIYRRSGVSDLGDMRRHYNMVMGSERVA